MSTRSSFKRKKMNDRKRNASTRTRYARRSKNLRISRDGSMNSRS